MRAAGLRPGTRIGLAAAALLALFFFFLHFLHELLDEFENSQLLDEFELELPAATATGPLSPRATCGAAPGAAATVTMIPVAPSFVA